VDLISSVLLKLQISGYVWVVWQAVHLEHIYSVMKNVVSLK